MFTSKEEVEEVFSGYKRSEVPPLPIIDPKGCMVEKVHEAEY